MGILVKRIVEKTRELTQVGDQRPKDNIKLGIGIRLTAERIYQGQVEFLQQHDQSKAQFNITSAQPFKDYLANVWNDWLKDKIGFSFYSLQTQGNFACYALADVLSKALHKPLYKFLIPTLEINESKNYDIPPNRLVLSKDQRTLIDVLECLDNARSSKSLELKHTHPVKDQNETLSEEEKNWVINHSEESRAYYQAIKDDASEEIKATARDNLAQYFTPLARDPKEDEFLLQKLYPRREDLVTAIKELNPENRESVLKEFKLETLKKMFLNNQELEVAIKDKRLYSPNDPLYNCAVTAILWCIYLKDLDTRGEFQHYGQGSLPDYIAKAHSKTTKKKAGSYCFNGLINGLQLHELYPTMEKAIQDDPNITENNKVFILTASKRKTHKTFREQAANLCDPEYLKSLNQVESKSSWTWLPRFGRK